MIECKFNSNDLRYMFLEGPEKEMKLLTGHFNRIPNYQFLPTFQGIPKAEIFINHTIISFKKVYYTFIGLWGEIYLFCKKNKIQIIGLEEKFFKREIEYSFEEFCEIVNGWNLKYTPRDYQLEAAYKILTYKQSCSQIATRAGKTLICYIVMRFIMETEKDKEHKFLMIVPSILLVKQGVDDYSDYQEFFKSEAIWSKGEFVESSNLTIGTFQSLIKKLDRRSKKYDPKWFNKFDVIVLDECHKGSANDIKKICSEPFMNKAILKFGVTGTLPLPNTIERFCIHTLFGPKIQDISAAELIENGYITPIEIKQVQIDARDFVDPTELRNIYIREAEYLISNYILDDKGKKIKSEIPILLRQEQKQLPPPIKEIQKKAYLSGEDGINNYYLYLIDFCKAQGKLLNLESAVIQYLDKRIEILSNLLKWEINRNCLILFHYKEYAQKVMGILKALFPERPIYLINGKVNMKKREEIKEMLRTTENAILVASYGVMSTGITLTNLHYGVHFESFKSHIINQQSLGRGLGLADDKDIYTVYDFVDILPTGKIQAQGKEKQKIYKEQKFPFDVIKINKRTKSGLIG